MANKTGDWKEKVYSESQLCCASWLRHFRFICTLFLERVGVGTPKRMKRVIYEQTGHQDGVVRKLWRSVWTCG